MKKVFLVLALALSVSAQAKLKPVKFDGYVVNAYMVAYATNHQEDSVARRIVQLYWRVVNRRSKQYDYSRYLLVTACRQYFGGSSPRVAEKRDIVVKPLFTTDHATSSK